MTRTIQTAHEVAKLLDLKINIEYGLGEWLGTDVDVQIPTREELQEYSNINWDYESLLELPTSEDKTDMFQRTKSVATMIVRQYLPLIHETYGSILLVSHAAPLIGVSRSLLKNPNAYIRTGTCSLGKYQCIQKGGQMTFEQIFNGHVSHLSEGEMNHWEFPGDEALKQ